VIESTQDGRPIIVYGKGESGQSVTMEVPAQRHSEPRQEMVTRLEQEIRDLETKIELQNAHDHWRADR
jgi:hypothetical protein